MRRRGQFLYFARARVERRVRQLQSEPLTKWPKGAKLAFDILHAKTSSAIARQIVVATVTPAHACALAMNQTIGDKFAIQKREELATALQRIGKCASRASSKLRRDLRSAMSKLKWENGIDLEVMESLLHNIGMVFVKYCSEEAARTALRAMSANDKRTHFDIKNSCSVLRPKDYVAMETQLNGLPRDEASKIFTALSSALAADRPHAPSKIHALITQYVCQLILIWLGAGLHPSRRVDPETYGQMSPFHRYADLMLKLTIDQLSISRTDADECEPDFRYRQNTYGHMLVADEHVKRALAQMKKSGLDIP
jgi:hypothetical protein